VLWKGGEDMSGQPAFKALTESTQEDWDRILKKQRPFVARLPDRIMQHLMLLEDDFDGLPIDRLQHSLQSAELAAEDGRDDEYVVCALLHDIGDSLGSLNHADVAAAILEPFVDEANHWMVKHHAIFQGHNFFHFIGMDRNLRDNFRGSPHYELTEEFVAKYDDIAFDYEKPKLAVSTFEPLLRKIFSSPKQSIYQHLME
jgi:predicted HD phosphohydrolase